MELLGLEKGGSSLLKKRGKSRLVYSEPVQVPGPCRPCCLLLERAPEESRNYAAPVGSSD